MYKIQLNKEMREAIEQRYAMFNSPLGYGIKNMVLDSYMPKLLTRYSTNVNNFEYENFLRNKPKTAYVISEAFAEKFNLQQLPFKYMLDILGISKKKLKRIMLDVKKKKYKLALIGAGGTGMNFIYWAEKILEEVELINIFTDMIIVDHDNIEFHNLLRFPMNLDRANLFRENLYGNDHVETEMILSKAMIASKFVKRLSKNVIAKVHDYNPLYNKYIIKRIFRTKEKRNRSHNDEQNYNVKYFEEEDVAIPANNMILYGAPDLETRQKIKDLEAKGIKIPFIAGLHGGSECELFLRPDTNQDLQIESYGIIVLTNFFFNQLAMTIRFLEYLAYEYSEDAEPGQIWKFDFQEFVEDGKAGEPDGKVINYQLQHNGTIPLR